MPNPASPGDPPSAKGAGGFVFLCLLALLATTLIPVAVAHWAGPAPDKGLDSYRQWLAVRQGWAVVTGLADLLAVTGVVLGFGYAVTGKVSGIALSSWNDYSLSKLQMALWTIVVLAGLVTAAKLNLLGYFGSMTPDKVLAIGIPTELLEAMGIAAFSTAAAPAILALKASQDATDEETAGARDRVAASSGGSADTMAVSGKAVGNTTSDAANWTDIVTGDEVANAGIVDLSKVQQLLITVLLVGTYVFMLIRMFALADAGGITALPPLDQHFIELMAVSHAGYLVFKAVPKSGTTGTAPQAQGDQAAPDGGALPGGGGTAPPIPPPPPQPNAVTVRLAIDNAAATQSLRLQVDGRDFPVGSDGCVELPLDMGVAHRLAATGTRAGVAVSGQTTITPTIDDMNKAYEITLA